jgi:hypothetical protein
LIQSVSNASRGEAARGVGERPHTGALEQLDHATGLGGIDTPERDGDDLGARGADRTLEHVEARRAPGPEDEP